MPVVVLNLNNSLVVNNLFLPNCNSFIRLSYIKSIPFKTSIELAKIEIPKGELISILLQILGCNKVNHLISDFVSIFFM